MESQSASPEFQSGHSLENEPVLSNPELSPNMPPSPEAPIASPEQSRNAEQLLVNHQGPGVSAVQQPVTVLPAVDDNQAQDDTTVTSSVPAVAKDEDVIEKEWVAKVKSVIGSTSDDPHRQQSMMSKMVADYVLKRYDRRIGDVGD